MRQELLIEFILAFGIMALLVAPLPSWAEDRTPAAVASPERGHNGGRFEQLPEAQDPGPTISEQDLEGMRLLAEEHGRFVTQTGTSALVRAAVERRAYERQRVELVEHAESQITGLEEALDAARRQAIEELEGFLERNPSHPVYTPDVMLRLGELYYEDSYERYLDEADHRAELEERREAGEEVALPPEPVRDFSRTINLYRRLIVGYPRYQYIDGVLYLLGFCLNQIGRFEEALVAWRHLVCVNHFQYTGPVDEDQWERDSSEDRGPFINPYVECTPVILRSQLLDEVWLRVGEYHFDYDYSAHGLDLAIFAYRNSMRDPQSPFYDKALYKLAWSYYRADRFAEAIRSFTRLVAFADEVRAATGNTGSEMRPEAIQYLGIIFAEDDWDNDAVPDAISGIDRLQDPALLTQDLPYTREVYIQTGDTYFDLARYPEAVRVYDIVLRRWPLLPEAPRILERIAEGYHRNREFEEETAARMRLLGYREGSEWAQANRTSHPSRVREAAFLARNVLYDSAVRYHQTAQQLRQRALEAEDEALLRRAVQQYELAARTYTSYLDQYPLDPDAYEISYNFAEALYFSGNFRQAAEAYAWVRDSFLDDRFLEQAAYRCIRALEASRDQDIRSGQLRIRDEPPEPQGYPPRITPLPMASILLQLNEAQDSYVRMLPHSERAPVYAYRSAQLLYRYGHWDEARARYTHIYEERCTSHETGFYAWQNLVNMAGTLDQLDEAERLAQTQLERNCSPPDR